MAGSDMAGGALFILSVCLSVGVCLSASVQPSLGRRLSLHVGSESYPQSVGSPAAATTIGGQVSRTGRLAMKQIIHTDKAPAAIGPYSQAVLVDRTLYVSGQLGMAASTGQLEEGVEAQTRLAMENIGYILEAANMTHSDIVKATVLLADMNDFTKVNDVYKTFFTEDYPARAAYQVAALPKGGLVEIESVAVKDI